MAESEVKKGINAVKNHWVAVLVAGAVLVILAFWYEHKNPGAVTGKLAKIPLIGGMFT
jgi:predicted outer membrane lipoprotein